MCFSYNSDSELDYFLKVIISYHPKLKFTCEFESAEKSNYLEFIIYRKDTIIYNLHSASTFYIHQESRSSYTSKGNMWKISFFEPTNFLPHFIIWTQKLSIFSLALKNGYNNNQLEK